MLCITPGRVIVISVRARVSHRRSCTRHNPHDPITTYLLVQTSHFKRIRCLPFPVTVLQVQPFHQTSKQELEQFMLMSCLMRSRVHYELFKSRGRPYQCSMDVLTTMLHADIGGCFELGTIAIATGLL